MKLLYTRYLNNNLCGAKVIENEKACYSYLNFVESRAKLEFKKFKGLKIKSNMNLLDITFYNNGGSYIEHKYELFEEV